MVKPDFAALNPTQGGKCTAWSGFGLYTYGPAEGYATERVRLEAADGGKSEGFLYRKGGETLVVCIMHPRGDFNAHYVLPALTAAGYAVFGQRSRYFNHDTGCVHEICALDAGAAVTALRARGFEKVILMGNSGGGSLFALYQAQATLHPPHRLSVTSAGDAYDLNGLDLPPADGLVLLAAHPGEGKYLLGAIDPSVMDEDDPLSCDPSLDMYNPENGFRPLSASSHYDPDFLRRYRHAQRERVARLDGIARNIISKRRGWQQRAAAPNFPTLPASEQQAIVRGARQSRFMTIYRTEADPRFCDISIQPSPRQTGSLLGPRPDLTNYQIGGFGAVMTPEAWLSTWSGISSHGSTVDNLKTVDVPLHIIRFKGDCCVYREDVEEMMSQASSSDKTLTELDGDHYGILSNGSLTGREQAGADLVGWLQRRFPAR
jgi:hypothetical protein